MDMPVLSLEAVPRGKRYSWIIHWIPGSLGRSSFQPKVHVATTKTLLGKSRVTEAIEADV